MARRRQKQKKETLAKKVSKIEKQLVARKPEVKYSWNYSSPTINNGPTAGIFPYRSIAVGTSDLNGRIGDKIHVQSFKCKGYLKLPAAYASSSFRCIAFVYKHNPDAITTSFATIINLYLESTLMNTNQAINSWVDHDNKDSFATLYDKTIAVNQYSASTDKVVPYNFSVKIPKKYQGVDYSNGGAYPSENELIIAFLSDTDDLLLYYLNYMVTYTDV